MKKKNTGFTLVESILLITVISVVMTLAFPDIISSFRFQKQYDEKSRMAEIREGLEAYAMVHMELPKRVDSGQTWGQKIAPYTSLSVNEIECDTWDRPREYRKGTLTQGIAGESFPVDYAIVYGYGENGCHGLSGACTERNNCSGGVRGAPTPALPESSFDTDVADFTINHYRDISEETGDHLVKFTTYAQRVQAFELTNKRLQRISKALSNFATEGYNTAVTEAQLNGATTMRDWNFYPPSGIDSSGNYHQEQVRNKVGSTAPYNGSSTIPNTRRAYMVSLMRLIGLPDDHCCNAMETYASGTLRLEEPFYYYSNPRARTSFTGVGSCGSRPTFGGLRQPPRVRVEADPCG